MATSSLLMQDEGALTRRALDDGHVGAHGARQAIKISARAPIGYGPRSRKNAWEAAPLVGMSNCWSRLVAVTVWASFHGPFSDALSCIV